jgi:hypothetical protein
MDGDLKALIQANIVCKRTRVALVCPPGVAVIILIFFHDHTISINHSLGNLLASRPKLQVAMNFQWTFSLTIALSFGIVAVAAASNDATL